MLTSASLLLSTVSPSIIFQLLRCRLLHFSLPFIILASYTWSPCNLPYHMPPTSTKLVLLSSHISHPFILLCSKKCPLGFWPFQVPQY
jgi:hypothetical protein